MIGGASAQSDVKIGYNGDQSAGGTAEFGIAGRYGFEAAIQDINANGGLLGRRVVGVVRDDQGTPPKSIQNMNELIDNEGVVAVVGPTNSGNAMAWLHIPQQKKVPVISHVATGSAITQRFAGEPHNYIFRLSLIDRDQVALLAAYAVKANGGGKIGIIADTSGYGQGVLKDLLEILNLHGTKPIVIEKFGPRDVDMTSQLLKIRDAGADTLIAASLSDANAHLLKSMEKIDFFPITLGTWGNGNSPVPNIAGMKLAERIFFIASTTETSNEKSTALYKRLIVTYPNMTAFDAAAQGYDAVLLIAAAIRQANSTNGEAVQAALEDLKPVKGIIKRYDRPFSKLNHEGLGASDISMARWQNGRVVRLEDDVTKALRPADLKR
jgi:branched-chain amino acid transport system substrate-binding protein